jgi:hypothetical protein
MKSLADGLPPEISRQIHPDWRRNEAAYWAVRDQLLSHYRDQWIGFADGAVIADASTPLEVFLAVQQSARHAFVIRVGHEDEPWYRIRRAIFSYDTAYPSAALPLISAEFRLASGSTGLLLERSHGRHGGDDGFLDLGLAGWSGISVPTSSRFHWPGANPGSGCAKSSGRAVPRSHRGGYCQSMTKALTSLHPSSRLGRQSLLLD